MVSFRVVARTVKKVENGNERSKTSVSNRTLARLLDIL